MSEAGTTATAPASVESPTQEQPQNPQPASSEKAETEESQQQQQSEGGNLTQKFDKMNISFSIWPPTQRTRDAVIARLIETLTTPSMLSKRYGSLPPDEASATARAIEEDAFNAAASAAADSGDGVTNIDAGIEILQVYSKEISKRMLESVKSRAANATPEVTSAQTAPEAPTPTAIDSGEGAASVENDPPS